MSNEEHIQQQLEAAQIQIQQLSQQITAAQDAARQTQAHLQAHLEQQQQQLAQLTAQNQRLQWIINTSPAITYTCKATPPYACTSISQSVELTLGYTAAEFQSEPDFWAQQIHPDDAPRIFAGISALFEQGRLLHEYRIRHRDEHYVWVRDELTLRRDAQGEPQEIVGFLANISDRKHTEIQLKQQLATIEATIDGIGITQDNRFIYVNRAQLDMVGYTAAELIGQPWTILYSADELARMEREVMPLVMRDHAWQGEVTATRKDGTTFAQGLSLTITEDGRTICVSKDISDRKQAERALQESQQMLQSVLDTTPISIFWKDRQLVYQGMNVAAAQNLGCESVNECVGLTDRQLPWHQKDAQVFEDCDRQILASGQPLLNQIHNLHLQDGTEIWIECNKVPLRDAAGNIIGVLGTAQDISDRKQAELALKTLSDRLIMSLQAGAFGNWEWDLDQEVVWDARMYEIFGLQDLGRAVTHQDWCDRVHPDDRVWLEANLPALLRGEISGNLEYRIYHPNGELHWLQGVASIQYNADGNPTGIFGLVRDITDRKHAELALQHLSDRLTLALQAGGYGIWEWNLEGALIWDDRMYTIFGLQNLGQVTTYEDWRVLVHPDDIERIKALVEPTLTSETPFNTEFRIMRPDGELRWIQSVAQVQRDRQGTPIRMVGINCDITDRKHAELALRRSEEELRLFINASSDIVYRVSADWQELQPLDGKDFINSTTTPMRSWLETYIPSEDQHRVWAAIQTAIATQRPFESEHRVIQQNGAIGWTFTRAIPMLNEQGAIVEWFGTASDITQRKQAELDLIEYAEQVEDLYNNAPCGYCSLNADSRITQINNTALRWLDYSRKDVVGQPITQFLTASSHQTFTERYAMLTQSDAVRSLEYEMTLLGSDGGQMAVLVSEQVQRDAGGTLIGSRITITDIRQRLRAERLLQQRLTQENLLRQITARIRQSLDLTTIFDTACQEVRQVLHADRVAIFRFFPESNYNDGEFIAESVVGDYPSVVAVPVHDHCFGNNFATLYAHGRYHAVADIEAEAISACHADILRQFQVRANLLMPLLDGKNALWGLLCIHQCSEPRSWQTPEIDLVQQLATQLAIALNQASLYQRIQTELAERQRAETQVLRQLEQQRTLAKLIETVRESLAVDHILRTVTQQVKDLLQCDRVIIFRLDPDGHSQIVEEAVAPEFAALKDMQWEDEVWSEEVLHHYWQGRPRIVPDVMHDIWTDCLIDYSQAGQIQSKIVAPILQEPHANTAHRWVDPSLDNQLWGILVAHACRERRVWHEPDAELLQQVANSVAIAIQQASLFTQLQQQLCDRQQAEQQLALRNQQLSLSNAELERATRLKDEFLANMSHELRTPLNAILGMTEGLQEEVFGPINERQHHSLTTIETSGNHLLSLINDVLDVAKIEAGQLDLDYAIVSVRRLCDSSLTLVKQQAHKKQLHVALHLANPLPDLYGDERRLRQILVNLLSNAVKFTPAGGHITITATYTPLTPEECCDRGILHPQADPTATQGILTLAVTDTGIGISPENTPKLFQPFIQIDSALNRQHEGTGLGLALVKRITEMHGGQVELTSAVGSGSCFTIHLPIIAMTPDGTPDRDRSIAVASPTNLAPVAVPLILLAEDNIANINTTAAYLTAKGYRLIVAKTGIEAVDLATTSNPRLILMDIQMPHLDGLEAIRQIRQNPNLATVPIIAITALAMPEDRDRCLAAGATDYLSKPIRLRHLAQMIQTLLTRPFPPLTS